ncbi:MAG: ribose-phosphate pyrophosphokinase [Lachnospiraceae bacterium]|nr:ribose-phosphate pyrophosphokinase [Lachnospiraceae bacterium]
MMTDEKTKEKWNLPVGPLALIALPGCEGLVNSVDSYLASWRRNRGLEVSGYQKDSYLLGVSLPRFGSGEAKGVIQKSVRGDDLYIVVDVCNYEVEYSMHGESNPMSPDDHFQNLKRVIAAAAGKAKRINVIMPFLYESRQHKRSARESLDCAMALQELTSMGVTNIITFDAHDPRVQNAIPMNGFETIMPTYQMVKQMLKTEEMIIDSDHMMVISPDEGAVGRAIYFSNMMGLDVGMFYKRRDYTRIVDGKNPIVAHEFLGSSVEGKDVIIVDDMIASGESVIDVAGQLKERRAGRVFVCATFGLFTKGMEKFDRAREAGLIDRIYTTNLIYQSPELLSRDYYTSVDMSEYLATLIDNLNHDTGLESLLSPTFKIQKRVMEFKEKQ